MTKSRSARFTKAKAIQATDLETLCDLEFLRQQNDADIPVPLDKLLGFAERQVERLRFLLDCKEEVAVADFEYAMGQVHQIGEMLRAQGRRML
jgi:hypothetical protein